MDLGAVERERGRKGIWGTGEVEKGIGLSVCVECHHISPIR